MCVYWLGAGEVCVCRGIRGGVGGRGLKEAGAVFVSNHGGESREVKVE